MPAPGRKALAPQAEFLKRRAAAYRAFYEHMPLPASSRPAGDAMKIYDSLDWGDLMRVHVLDGRQYRSRGACYGPGKGGGHVETLQSCPELADPPALCSAKSRKAGCTSRCPDRPRAGT